MPQVQTELAGWLTTARSGEGAELDSRLGFAVPKERVAKDGEYNLTGDRYRATVQRDSVWPFLKVQDVFTKGVETVIPETLDGSITYIGLENITSGLGTLTGETLVNDPKEIKSLKNRFVRGDILYGKLRPNLNKVWLADCEGICSTDIFVIRADPTKTDARLYAHLFRQSHFNQMVISEIKGAQLPRVGWQSFGAIKIPLPPIEVQREIVAEIEGYQKIIDGARAVLGNYRPHIPIDKAWPVAKLGDICTSISDGDHQPPPKSDEGVPFITISNLNELTGVQFEKTFFVPVEYYEALKDHRKPRLGDILYSVTGSYGVTVPVTTERPFCFQRHIALFRPSSSVLPDYLLSILRSPFGKQQGDAAATGVAQKTVSLTSLREFKIPLPPLETQQAIVDEITAEQMLVAANRELIVRFQVKIEQAIVRIWGGVIEVTSEEVSA